MQLIIQASVPSHNFTDSGVDIARKPQEELSTLQIAQLEPFPATTQANPTDRLISIGGTIGFSILGFL
ncbi:MAG: hypothetical protein ACRC8Y_17665, partial [Chroococcales cyanobacterium]